MDAEAGRLYIAHGTVVQAVDVNTGTVTGEIRGLGEAHTIALDNTGEYGYVSDGRANDVKVFDRRTLDVVATIPTVPNPRELVFEPNTKLLFAVCTTPAGAAVGPLASCDAEEEEQPRRPGARPHAVSSIAVIDTETRTALGEILLPGKLGFAASNGNGQVFVSVTDRNEVLRIDADAVGTELRRQAEGAKAPSEKKPGDSTSAPDRAFKPAAVVDWSRDGLPREDGIVFRLPSGCEVPVALAFDGEHFRLFAACNNWKLAVVNALNGSQVALLTTGPGTDAIAYDPERELIYSANGGGYGSLTVISQDANTDSYSVVQVLPTRERARTLAVNSSNGDVYLVTDFVGVDLSKAGGIGTMKTVPVNGSFQVLDIGR
jgi:YVTN family beta-propeller protein